MSTSNHFEVVDMIEGFSDVLTESVSSTSWVHTPSWSVIRVWPQKITHRSLVRNFLDSFQRSDVVQSFNWWRKPTVKAEKWVFNNCSQREIVEKFRQSFPNVAVSIFSWTLIIESVYLSDLPGFVITSENDDSVFVPDLEGNQKSDGFNTVVSSDIWKNLPRST